MAAFPIDLGAYQRISLDPSTPTLTAEQREERHEIRREARSVAVAAPPVAERRLGRGGQHDAHDGGHAQRAQRDVPTVAPDQVLHSEAERIEHEQSSRRRNELSREAGQIAARLEAAPARVVVGQPDAKYRLAVAEERREPGPPDREDDRVGAEHRQDAPHEPGRRRACERAGGEGVGEVEFASPLFAHLSDCLRDCNGALGFFQMQQLGHLAVHFQDAFACIGRVCERLDHRLSLLYIGGSWRKDLIGRFKLGRMDQGFTIEAQEPPLLAFGPQALFVTNAVKDAIYRE